VKDGPQEVFDRLPVFLTTPKWAYAPIILFAVGSAILAVRFAAPLRRGTLRHSNGSERVIIDSSPESLQTLLKGHTAIQQKKITEIYIGKWLKISGPVFDVLQTSSKDTTLVALRPNGLSGMAKLWFSKGWSERTSTLRVGQNVSVIGKITYISELDIELHECELETHALG
jgi:hypothetical protein